MAPRRVNGFGKPYHPLQVATWSAMPVLMLQFLFFVSPILPLAASIPCTLLFFACAFTASYYVYKACLIDPMDHHLAMHLRESGEITENNAQTEGCFSRFLHSNAPTPNTTLPQESMKYCWVCELSVAEHSMHCKYCNKCVAHFDHHCLWLNTCVGEANYDFFYNILWSISAMLLVHFSIMLGLVIDIFTHGPTEQRAEDWFQVGLWQVVTGVLIFFIVFDAVCISAAVQLLHFHIGLRRKQLTTYQFIVTDNVKRRQQRQKKEERRSRRVVAVTKARRDGHALKALRLQMGQYCCVACDPLPSQEAPADDANGGANDSKSSGYAELEDGNDMHGVSSDEKVSSTSLRDLARSNATSLGGSSSSHNGDEVKQQDEHSQDNFDQKAESNNTCVQESDLKVQEGESNVEEGGTPSDKV